MKTNFNLKLVTVVAVFSFWGMGCGQSFKSGNTGSSNNSSSTSTTPGPDISGAMAKASQSSATAQQAMAEAVAAIASISDANGNIQIHLFQSGSGPGSGSANPVVNFLQPVFDKVYAQAQVVQSDFAKARLTLMDAMGKLNPNDPQQEQMIQQINNAITQIDMYDSQFKLAMQNLAQKLNFALNGIDKLVSGVTAMIPIPFVGFLVGMGIDLLLVDDVKTMIQTFQLKLMAL